MVAKALLRTRAKEFVVAGGMLLAACSAPSETPPDNPPPKTTPVPPELCRSADDDGKAVDFFSEIQPILGDRCVRCHGGVRELGVPKLNLQMRERAAPMLGQVGDPCSSELFRRIATTDEGSRMPLGGAALSPDEIALVRRWIEEGAPWPEHWAFAPLSAVDPSAIAVKSEAWIKTPIDRFIVARLERAAITPAPPADRTTLLRRVSFDLVGLPPTPAEVDAFVADEAPDAYEKVVDRLLQSPRFGETWGRHWLDQARFADTDGYEKDEIRPNTWRYRDWVIDSINRDQPFDQFTIEQIAGDLIPAASPQQIAGTGFHRQALLNPEFGVDPEEDRTKRVIDRVAAVGTAWLGLTLGCAQCHSHPYDPIAQKEFYELYAFFNNADESTVAVPAIGTSPAGNADIVRDTGTRSTYLLIRGDFLNPDKNEALTPSTPGILRPFRPKNASAPNRLDLARWIVDRSNPLPPRVAVNNIWYHLFGQGIVATLDDFGSRARLPSHPELLDWLARDFVDHGWQRKRTIKQIVLSATYRQSASPRPDVTLPDNALLYRQNRLRFASETVADSCLFSSGLLAARIGGPSVYPPIQREVLNISVYETPWPTSTGDDRHRRAMYTFHKRTIPYPSLQIFDQPTAYASSAGRNRSNTPLQALVKMHDPVFVDAARALARRAQVEAPGDRKAALLLAFRLTVARAPAAAELAELEKLLDDVLAAYEADPQAAADVVGEYAPPNVPAATAAAWVIAAQVLLNLDEAITRE
ncbi:MAG: PSD1 and planctomycete cytochrome C domain-containing protein [Polyangiaceae bacterium]